jgi:glycosyltransferase involved in cell wall biosynthesis
MTKILFYINTIAPGGAERVMVNLANMFSNTGYEVVFVTSYYDSNEYQLSKYIKRLSLESERTKQSFLKKNISRICKLRKICKIERPNIVISFLPEPNFRAIIATMFLGIKTIISVRNDPNREYSSIIYKCLAKILYPLASGVVFQTEEAKNWFSKRIRRKSKIILNPVNEKFFKVNFSGKRNNVVTVGRLESQKNHQLLIKAFARVSEEFRDECLLIYGEGSQKRALHELIKSLNLEDRVVFKGISKNLEEEIKDAKVFVLSSDYEGLPNAVMEAMVLGLPVISTDCPCGGPRLLIDHNKSGILVRPNDVEAMAKAIYNVLSNPFFAEQLGMKAKNRAKNFAPDKVFEEWEEYIRCATNSQ